jgi:F-type H+-transporting ATPase subunit b
MRFILILLFALTPLHAYAGGGGSFDLTPFLGFVLNFVILFGGTGYLLRKKIARFFAARAQHISEDLEEAKTLQDEANALIGRCEDKLSQLEKEQQEILARFKKDGETEKARLIAEAKDESERIRKESEFRLNQEVEQAKKRLLSEAVPMIIELAEKSVVERLDQQTKDQFVEDGISHLRSISAEQLVQ